MGTDKLGISISDDVVVKTKDATGIFTPKRYTVVLMNDDYTPIDFVISLLIDIFHHNMESAKNLTTIIHSAGSGIAGTYDFEIAEQKAVEATSMSRDNKFPLVVKLEPVE
jgi:ATP-dependent Clp protease adaptor protein ClpS